MADEIKRDEIIPKQAIDAVIKDFEGLRDVVIATADELKEILKTSSALAKLNPVKNFKDFEKLSTQIEKVNKATDSLTRLEKEKIALDQKLKDLNSTRIDQNTELKILISEQQKTNKDFVKSKLGLVSVYQKEVKTLRELKNKLKTLVLTEGEGSKATKKLAKEVQNLDQKIKRADAVAGDFQRNVGNYPKGLKGAIGSLRSFASALGIIGGVQALAGATRNAFNTFKNFEQANTELSSILRTNTEGIAELTAQAKLLGATTAFTATEVIKLQEAYARLGFSQKQILELTPGTIQGSVALRSTAEETANLIGAIVKSFDSFEARNTPEIIDSLTRATQASALNFDKLNTAIPIVSGAANAAGVGFNELVSLLGKLSDAGIDASSSSTALRNIFIESAKQGLSYEQIIEKIKNSQDKLTVANDEFGKRAAVSATVLAQNIDGARDLKKSLDEAGGTAKEVADNNLNTLEGSLILLKSSWEGFILSLNDGNGSFGKTIRNVVKLGTEVLNILSGIKATDSRMGRFAQTLITASKVVASLVAGFVAYKAVVIANTIRLKALELIQNRATIATKAMNTAMKANVFGLVASAVVALITYLGFLNDKTKEVTESQERFNDALRESNELMERTRAIDERVKALDKLRKTQVENLLSDIEAEIRSNEEKEAKILGFKENNLDKIKKIEAENAEEIKRIQAELSEALDEGDQERAFSAKLRIEALEAENGIKRDLIRETFLLTESEVQGNIKLLESQKLIVAQRLKALEIQEKGKGKATETQIDNEFRLTDVIITEAEKRAEIVSAITKALIKEEDEIKRSTLDKYIKDQLDKEDEAAKKSKERVENLLNQIQKRTFEIADENAGKRLEGIDKEIAQREKAVAQQQQLAELGQANTLGEEIAALDKAEAEKERLQKREEARQKKRIFFELFLAKIKEASSADKSTKEASSADKSTSQAALEALGELALAEGIAQSLAGAFAEGVEGLKGKGTETSDSNLALLSKNESVITAKGTKENSGLATAMNTSKKAVKEWFYKNEQPQLITQSYDDRTGELIEVSKQMLKHLKNNKAPEINWTSRDEMIQRWIQDGVNKKLTVIRKTMPRI